MEKQPREDDGKISLQCVVLFGLTVLQAKTETMCLMTKRMEGGQEYKLATKVVCLGANACGNADLTAEPTGACCWPTYVSDGIVCHCTTRVRRNKAEVIETVLFGCTAWSPTVAHLAILRAAHH